MATFVAAMRVLVGALPSALLVIAVFLISTLALALGDERRRYALEVVDRMLKLAAVLVGLGPSEPEQVIGAKRSEEAEPPMELKGQRKEGGCHRP